MDPTKLKSNQELLEYLNIIIKKLQANGQNALAEDVTCATHFAIGSASEFLHEAQVALTKIIKIYPAIFSIEMLQEIQLVILQINEAFRKIGGA